MVRSNTASPACPAPAARRSARNRREQRAQQGQGRDQETHRRYRHRVRQRRAHRHLAHPEGQQGRQPQRHQQLQVAGLPQPRRHASAQAGRRIHRRRNDAQQDGDRAERQPEARRHRRPGVQRAVTKAAATASTRPPVKGRRDMYAASTVASMKKVRRAGTPQPASRQYSNATQAAAMPPTMPRRRALGQSDAAPTRAAATGTRPACPPRRRSR